MTDNAQPNVYQAINAITAELAAIGIAKNRENPQQHFMYRGIDDVQNALAPLLAKHGLVIMPSVLKRKVKERPTQSGKGVLFTVVLTVQFKFIYTANPESCHSILLVGEAMDMADKATNKAMSAAYKYACLHVFCIPVEGTDDADASSPQPGIKETRTKTKGPFEAGKAKLADSDANVKRELDITAKTIEGIDKMFLEAGYSTVDKGWAEASNILGFRSKREGAERIDEIDTWLTVKRKPEEAKQ